MAKKIGIIAGIAIIVLAFGFLIYAMVISAVNTKKMDETIITISFKELEKNLEKKETFILVITQKNCSHCAEYQPVLKEVLAENELVAYEIEQTSLTDAELAKLKDIASISGTPTTVFIEEGQEKSTATRIKGAGHSKRAIKNRLKAMGYIKDNN